MPSHQVLDTDIGQPRRCPVESFLAGLENSFLHLLISQQCLAGIFIESAEYPIEISDYPVRPDPQNSLVRSVTLFFIVPIFFIPSFREIATEIENLKILYICVDVQSSGFEQLKPPNFVDRGKQIHIHDLELFKRKLERTLYRFSNDFHRLATHHRLIPFPSGIGGLAKKLSFGEIRVLPDLVRNEEEADNDANVGPEGEPAIQFICFHTAPF
jgi:hypothetical protein